MGDGRPGCVAGREGAGREREREKSHIPVPEHTRTGRGTKSQNNDEVPGADRGSASRSLKP